MIDLALAGMKANPTLVLNLAGDEPDVVLMHAKEILEGILVDSLDARAAIMHSHDAEPSDHITAAELYTKAKQAQEKINLIASKTTALLHSPGM
jgi:hypothetical protein